MSAADFWADAFDGDDGIARDDAPRTPARSAALAVLDSDEALGAYVRSMERAGSGRPLARPEPRWPTDDPRHVPLPASSPRVAGRPTGTLTVSGDVPCRVVLALVAGPADSHQVAAAVGADVAAVQTALCHLRGRQVVASGGRVTAANGRRVRIWRLGPRAPGLLLRDGPSPGVLDVPDAPPRASAPPRDLAPVVVRRRPSPPGHVASVVASMLGEGVPFTSADAAQRADCGRTAVERAIRACVDGGVAEPCGVRPAGRGYATLWRARVAA